MIMYLFIDKIPDTWEPHVVWYLSGFEFILLDVPIFAYLIALIRWYIS